MNEKRLKKNAFDLLDVSTRDHAHLWSRMCSPSLQSTTRAVSNEKAQSKSGNISMRVISYETK